MNNFHEEPFSAQKIPLRIEINFLHLLPSFNLSELILFIDQYLLFPSLPSSMCYIDFYLQTKWLHREGTDGCRRGKQKKYELNYVINSLTIMRIIQICYLVPSIKPYRIYNCLMVVRSHTNGEIEKT